MQNLTYQHLRYLIPILLFSLFISCNKDTDSGETPYPGVWGQLVATKENRKVISGNDTADQYTELANAHFYSSALTPNILVSAGTVKLNDVVVTLNSGNEYYLSAAQGFGLSSHMHWYITGSGTVPVISYEDTSSFPTYHGVLPYTINKSAGLSLLIDSTTIEKADSVRITINDGTGSGSGLWELRVAAQAGVVNITPSMLNNLAFISDNTGIIGVSPYKGSVKVFDNKGFFFVKETRYYQAINIH